MLHAQGRRETNQSFPHEFGGNPENQNERILGFANEHAPGTRFSTTKKTGEHVPGFVLSIYLHFFRRLTIRNPAPAMRARSRITPHCPIVGMGLHAPADGAPGSTIVPFTVKSASPL